MIDLIGWTCAIAHLIPWGLFGDLVWSAGLFDDLFGLEHGLDAGQGAQVHGIEGRRDAHGVPNEALTLILKGGTIAIGNEIRLELHILVGAKREEKKKLLIRWLVGLFVCWNAILV